MIPGELFLQSAPIQANAERETVEIEVDNTAGRPIQVGSHFHFFEANKALVFPRRLAFGKHLNIPAGTAVRFEPKKLASSPVRCSSTTTSPPASP
jgi:urease beta subunit